MSLISEALKEAQRERTERAGPRAAATIVDSIFPYPSKAGRGAPNRNLIIGATIAVVLIGGAGLGLRWFSQRAPKAGITALPKRPVVAQQHVAPPVAAPIASPVAATLAPRPEPKSTVAAVVSAPARKAAAPIVAPATPAPRIPARDSVIAKPPAPSVPSPAPVVQPQGTPSSSGVRIVLDPSGGRPADSLFARAYAEHKRGNFDMARDLYEKALAKPPVAPELYNNYGALLASMNNPTAAIAMYSLGLKVNENDARLWTNLASSYNATGRHAEAMAAYAQAAKLDPSNGIVKTRLAAEYTAIGDTSSARRMYEDAVRVAPRDAGVHHAYGSYLQSQRDFKGAIRELQLFVDLAPGAYDQATIDGIKKHIATLRQANP
jgi:Tfp pilus assembly protein PilF